MQFAPLAEDQVSQLCSMLASACAFDSPTQQLLQEKAFGDPDQRPQDCLMAWEGQSVAGYCQFLWRLRPGGLRQGYIKLLAVAPQYRRRGLASRLMELAESTLREQGVSVVRLLESYPNYLCPGLDVRYTPAILLLEKLAYSKVSETYNLHCPLQTFYQEEHVEQRLRDCGIEIARAEADGRLTDFIREHFPNWLAEVTVMLGHSLPTVFLAQRRGDILGFAGYDGNNIGQAWFGPMGTAPDSQGQGIGAGLLHQVLRELRQQGHQFCTIPWVGPYGFYARYSQARIDRVFWRYEKALV